MGGVSRLLKPKMPAMPAPVAAPVVNQEIVDRNVFDTLRRRMGSRATITGASQMGTTSGSVATKELLGQ